MQLSSTELHQFQKSFGSRDLFVPLMLFLFFQCLLFLRGFFPDEFPLQVLAHGLVFKLSNNGADDVKSSGIFIDRFKSARHFFFIRRSENPAKVRCFCDRTVRPIFFPISSKNRKFLRKQKDYRISEDFWFFVNKKKLEKERRKKISAVTKSKIKSEVINF